MGRLPAPNGRVAAELIAGQRTPAMLANKVTAILYTSHRVSAFQRLMDGWGNRHTMLVIADASPTGYVRGQDVPDWCDVVRVDPLKTMGAALNEMLDYVKTPYVTLVMDDWVMAPSYKPEYLAAICEAGRYTMVSGRVLDLPRTSGQFSSLRRDVCRAYMARTSDASDEEELRLIPVDWDPQDSVVPVPIVSQHYVARTKSLRDAGGWSPDLRSCHHLNLCLSLQADGHSVAVTGVSLASHAPTDPMPEYDAVRAENNALGRLQLMEKWGVRRIFGIEEWNAEE